MNWEPIKTAPKDGTMIDAWSPELSERLTDVKWSTVGRHDYKDYPSQWVVWTGEEWEDVSVELTHWVLLPEPPK